MQSVRWLSFSLASSLTRTLVHFFPYSHTVAAPYVSQCRLTVFGPGVERRTVILDGARLSHPDGVKVEDAFPELSSVADATPSGFGLEIELLTLQQRADLGASGCVVELTAPTRNTGQICRYWPSRLPDSISELPSDGPTISPPRTILALRDAFVTTSILVVNGRDEGVKIALSGVVDSTDGATFTGNSYSDSFVAEPGRVTEFDLPAQLFEDAPPQSCGWGLVRGRTLRFGIDEEVWRRGVVAYLVQRHPETRRPVTISAL